MTMEDIDKILDQYKAAVLTWLERNKATFLHVTAKPIDSTLPLSPANVSIQVHGLERGPLRGELLVFARNRGFHIETEG